MLSTSFGWRIAEKALRISDLGLRKKTLQMADCGVGVKKETSDNKAVTSDKKQESRDEKRKTRVVFQQFNYK